MSKPEEKESRGYLVGYGKPPEEHQFKKGRSGNPSGRPKGRKEERKLIARDKPTQDMILEEAYRMVTLREGDRIIELPAIQAVLRAMGVAAMKGNRFAQKSLTQIVQQVEQEHRDIQYANIESFTEYKVKWNQEIERCRRQGLPEPAPLPHPDDVIIDYRSGDFRIAGPVTKEEKAKWDVLLEHRDDAQEHVLYYARKLKRAPGNAHYREELLDWQSVFDMVNDRMPERYKKTLQGRLVHPQSAND